jgi:hypothetical protein
MKAAPFACALLFVSPAQLWAPDVVSTAQSEVRVTFSPDGQRMLWGAIGWSGTPGTTGGGWDIYESERSDGGWSKPRIVAFNSTANDFDPSFAPDGSGVYFFSNREGGFGKDDIYFAPSTHARAFTAQPGIRAQRSIRLAMNGRRSYRPTAVAGARTSTGSTTGCNADTLV